MKTNKNESYKIQILRAISIIAVVIIHALPGECLGIIFIRPFVNFGVGLFLFLSGMLSSVKTWNPLKRIRRVVIPYIIWSAIYVFIMCHNDLNLFPVTFVKKAIIGQASAPFYYIFVYCEFALLIPLIDKIAKSKYKKIAFLIPILEIIFTRMLPIMLGIIGVHRYVLSVQAILCVAWFGYFYLGYLLGNNLINIKISNDKLLILLAVGFVWQFAEGFWLYKKKYGDYAGQLKLSAVFVGLIICVFAYRFIVSDLNINNKLLKAIGDSSFGIYLSHMVVLNVLYDQPSSIVTRFPGNAVISLFASFLFVWAGRHICGDKISRWLGFK